MYQKHELFGELSTDDIFETLKACTLEQKDEYMEDEADRFRECRALIEQGKTYKQAAAQFRKQDKLKPPGDAQVDANTLEMLELLALAGEQVGGKISLIEAGKILVACGLPDKEEYTGAECDRFVEACVLVKQQGKTYQEVAVHFGVANGDNQQQRQEIIGEIQDMMKQATAMISAAQADKIQQTISKMTLVQLKEIRAQIEQQTALRLQEYIDSGRMERELQAAADLVINEPFLTWSPVETRTLNGNRDRKSLPGS